MSYLIHFIVILILSFNSFASVKDNILSDCKQALEEVVKLTPTERQETILFIERILSVNPEVSPSVSIRLMPSAQTFAMSDDLRKSLIPARNPEAIECALKLLPNLLPESILLLPIIVKQSVEARTSHEVQESYEKTAIKLIQEAVQKSLPISPQIIKDISMLLSGDTASLAQVIILEIGAEAIPDMLTVSTSADEELFQKIIQTVRMLKPKCNDLPEMLLKMIASVDDELRLRAVSYLQQCSEVSSKVRDKAIALLGDKNIEVRKAAATYILSFVFDASDSELYQIISLVNDKEWVEFFIPSIRKSDNLKNSFHRASFSNIDGVSSEIALRILDVAKKEDIKLLQSLVSNKKSPAFLRIAAVRSLLRMESGIEEVTKLLAEKPDVVINEEDKLQLIIELFSVQYVSQYKDLFIPLFRNLKLKENELFFKASKNVLPKLSSKDIESIVRAGSVELLLDLLSKIKLTDSKVMAYLLREANNDSSTKNRVLWAKALSHYSKELKFEVSKRIKGVFDPKSFLIASSLNLLSKQQVSQALSKDDFNCEERNVFLSNLSLTAETRENFIKSLLSCIKEENIEYSSTLISTLKPFSESEEEHILSSLPIKPNQVSVASLEFEFSLPRETRFIDSLFQNATPIETRDLFRSLSERPYVSTPLLEQAKRIYESTSDEALKYEALKLIVKYSHDGFDSKNAVRAYLRDTTNFEKGVALLKTMRPEEASIALSQALRELPVEQLRSLIELIPSLGIHDPSLIGAVEEVSARVTDPETQYRLAAMRIALNPDSPDVDNKLEKYFLSRFSREFKDLLIPYKNRIEKVLIKMKTKNKSQAVRSLSADLLDAPIPATN